MMLGKYYPAIGAEILDKSFTNQNDAIQFAKDVQIKNLQHIAVSIVGEGNEYKGIIAESLITGN
jgi:hypothetical protein